MNDGKPCILFPSQVVEGEPQRPPVFAVQHPSYFPSSKKPRIGWVFRSDEEAEDGLLIMAAGVHRILSRGGVGLECIPIYSGTICRLMARPPTGN